MYKHLIEDLQLPEADSNLLPREVLPPEALAWLEDLERRMRQKYIIKVYKGRHLSDWKFFNKTTGKFEYPDGHVHRDIDE